MTILTVEQNEQGQAVVEARSGLTGQVHKRPYAMDRMTLMRGLADHAAGALIQNVFPTLTADEREFLMTGITPEEWDDAFGDDG